MPSLPVGFKDRFNLSDTLPEKTVVETGDFLGDTTKPVPLIYGRRWVTGVLIEQVIQQLSGGDFQVANFYAVGEGEIASIEQYKVNGVSTTDSQESGVKVLGIYYRDGDAGTDDTETEAEYTADPTTQLRAQNFDYRSKTATAYSETAYVILLSKVDALFEVLGNTPRLDLDVKGIKVNSYSSTGSVTATAFSETAPWIFADYCLSDKHGFGLTTAEIDFAVLKDSADFCENIISGTEASTSVNTTQNPASTQMVVASTEGFVRGQTVRIAGSTDVTVSKIVSDTEMTLETATTQSSGDSAIQRSPRFRSAIYVDRVGKVDRFLKQLLLSCRGYITHDAGKLQFRIEKADVAEVLTDGGLETWASATDLTNWSETTVGGSVNQTTDSNGGTYAARMDKTDSSTSANLHIAQTGVTLDPGRFYRVEFYAKTDTTQTGVAAVRVFNSTASEWLQADGSWAGSAVQLVTADVNATYAKQSLVFRTKQSFGAADSYTVQFTATLASSGSSVFFDDCSLRGPYGGHFKELSPNPGFGIRAGSFRWELPEPVRQVNRVAITIENEGSDVGRDEVVEQDFDHQLNNPVKTLRLRGEAIADRDQAARIGRFILDKARALDTGGRFTAGHGALPLQPGDIILVDHAVPNWTEQELRVTHTRKKGLGDAEDLFVDLECEDYDETIYKDTSVVARGVPSRPAGVLTITVNSATSKRVDVTAAFDDNQMVVQRYFLHVGTAASFVPTVNTVRATSQANRLVYVPRESEVDSTVYLVVDAMTDRGAVRSAEVAQYISYVSSDDLQDTALQQASRFNLVKDGDFDTAGDGDTGWQSDTSATGPIRFPANQTGNYNDPENAENTDSSNFALGSVTVVSTTRSQTWTFSDIGTLDVVLSTEQYINSTLSTGAVQYSTNSGSSWSVLASATTTTATSNVTLTGQNLVNLHVRALATFSTGPAGHRVMQIHATTQAQASLTNSVVALAAGGKAWRRFPLDITASRTHLPPSSKVSLAMSAKRLNSGEALDDTVDISIQDDGGSWSQVLHSIAAADVLDTWSQFGLAGITVTTSVTSDQWRVYVTCNSELGVDVDKLVIVRGEQVPMFEPSPIEMSGAAGTIGDYGTGNTAGAPTFQLGQKFTALKEIP